MGRAVQRANERRVRIERQYFPGSSVWCFPLCDGGSSRSSPACRRIPCACYCPRPRPRVPASRSRRPLLHRPGRSIRSLEFSLKLKHFLRQPLGRNLLPGYVVNVAVKQQALWFLSPRKDPKQDCRARRRQGCMEESIPLDRSLCGRLRLAMEPRSKLFVCYALLLVGILRFQNLDCFLLVQASRPMPFGQPLSLARLFLLHRWRGANLFAPRDSD